MGQNTLADDLGYWKDYILPSGIADIPLNQLGRTKLKTWSCQTVTKYGMKKKYFANVKRTLNSLLDYAVDEELIDVNRLRSIKLNSHLYKPAAFKEENEEVFSEQEQQLVMEEAENDCKATGSALPLGICILFLTGMRVGELCALRNCDIKRNYLYINQMVIEKQSETSDGSLKRDGYMIVPHAKSSAGMRMIYLPEKARRYFEQIRELNKKNGYPCGDKDLVFQRKQGMCNQRVFDARLKKYCTPKHLGLSFAKSCHDIRYPNLNKIQTFQRKYENRNKYRLKRFGYYFYLFLLKPQKSTREPSGFFHFADTFLSFSSSRVDSAFAFSSAVMSR